MNFSISNFVENDETTFDNVSIKSEPLSENNSPISTPSNKRMFSTEDYDNEETKRFKLDGTGGGGGGDESMGGELSERQKVSQFNILTSDYFKIVEKTDKIIRVSCQICNNGKILKGYGTVTSNFLKHLKKQHLEDYKLYIERKKNKYISFMADKASPANTVPYPDSFEEKLMSFIIDTFHPVEFVENRHFKALFPEEYQKCINAKNLAEKINVSYMNSIGKVKFILAKTKYICMTADIWNIPEGRKDCIMAVSCHWLNSALERKSFTVFCQRINERINTNERKISIIQDVLAQIMFKFNLKKSQIIGIVNDNQSNYSDVSKDFGIAKAGCSDDLDLPEISCLSFTSTEDGGIPNHYSNTCHSLKLLATTDMNNSLKSDQELETISEQVFTKCLFLWTKASNTKTGKIIEHLLGFTLIVPEPLNNWRSFYDGIEQILSNSNKLRKLCEQLNYNCKFTEDELKFLQEYKTIMEPIAKALDFLREDKNCFYGYLLPTVFSLRTKFRKIEVSGQIRGMKKVLECLIVALEKRFEDIFKLKSETAIVAAITCPDVKVRWLPVANRTNPNFDIESVHSLLNKIAREESCSQAERKSNSSNASTSLDFFDFGDDETPSTSRENTSSEYFEFLRYLADNRQTFEMLNDYPFVKEIFIKLNTILLSPNADRFHFLENTIKEIADSNLFDGDFEKYIILRANQIISVNEENAKK